MKRSPPAFLPPPTSGPLAILRGAVGAFFFDDVEERTTSTYAGGAIAVVTVRGPLMHHESFWWDSYEELSSRVASALAAKPKALVLALDTPGGLVAGCFETANAIKAMCASAEVPLHAFVDGMAASAGYALACVAASITMPRTGHVGSIGCIEALVDHTASNEKWGVRVELITSGAFKADGHPDAPISDSARASSRERVEECAALFCDHVASHRPGLKADAVRGLEAALFMGAKAVAVGLADRIGTLEDLVAKLAAGTALSAQEGPNVSEEEKNARAALQAIIDDEKSDEKAKARARAALVAMDAVENDDEADKDKNKGDDGSSASSSSATSTATVSAAAAGAIAGTAITLEQRVAQLEERETAERKAALFAKRPDVGATLRAALEPLALGQIEKILAETPRKPTNPAVAAANATPTRGASQASTDTPPSALPSNPLLASLKRVMDGEATSQGIVRSAHEISFNPLTREQAAAELAKKGAAR